MRYKLTFTYDGTNYFGYAKQVGQLGIQEVIEKVLFTIFQEEITLNASGRTDKGVHALNQVAHFDAKKDIEINKLMCSLNKLLPDDIYVKNVEKVDDNFHARFNVKKKCYKYLINLKEYNPLRRNYEYFVFNLDINKMLEASKIFIGTHNYQNFTSKETDEDGFIRTIYEINFNIKDDILEIEFIGDGFMRYEIRKIVGSLIEVGRNKITKEELLIYLNSKERKIISYQAPSKGLYLVRPIY